MQRLDVQTKRMSVEQTRAYFSKRASFYQPVVVKMMGYGYILRALLVDRDVLTSNMKVLDAGAGTGLMTRILYPMAREKGLSNTIFHAIDLTPAMLDVLRSWIRAEGAEDVISTRIQDVLQLETMPEGWDGYDLIVSSGMLEYIPPESLHKVIAGLIHRLKPGGKLICCFSGRTILMRILVGWMWRCNLYTKSELDVIFAKAGATEVRHLSFPRPYHSTDPHMPAVEITRPAA